MIKPTMDQMRPILTTPRADCAFRGKCIELIGERWTHVKDGWIHTRQRHTAQPRQSAEVTV